MGNMFAVIFIGGNLFLQITGKTAKISKIRTSRNFVPHSSYMAFNLGFFQIEKATNINIGKKRKKKGKSAKKKEKRRRLAEARKVCKQLMVFYKIIYKSVVFQNHSVILYHCWRQSLFSCLTSIIFNLLWVLRLVNSSLWLQWSLLAPCHKDILQGENLHPNKRNSILLMLINVFFIWFSDYFQFVPI